MSSCCKTTDIREGAGKRMPRALMVLGTVMALSIGIVVIKAAFAQDGHGHGGHEKGGEDHGGQKGEKFSMPSSYGAAIVAIDARMGNIEHLIDTKKLESVHGEAQVICDVAKGLAQLALKADSGVPKEAVKEINVTAKALADKFEPIDEAGDSGNLEATKKIFKEMLALQATLKKYVQDVYRCPMKCEGDKTYSKPGECPVCNMHLKKLTSDKFAVDVKPAGSLEPGKSTTLLFTIKDPLGKVVKELEVVHEKILHLLMVSKDLSWYAHEHPELGPDGTFTLAFTFPAAGEYFLYHDFTPPAVGQQVVQVQITVAGQAPAAIPLKVDSEKPKLFEGYTFKFSTKAPLNTNEDAELIFEVSKDGKPVNDLQPYLGAMGHLVIISQDLKTFVHSHPHEEGEESGHGDDGKGESGGKHAGDHKKESAAAASSGPDIHFHAHFEAPGIYKGWGQFQHLGKILTVPVVMEVREGGDSSGKKGGGHKH